MTYTRLMLVRGLLVTAMLAAPAIAQDKAGGEANPPLTPATGRIPENLGKALKLWEDYVHYSRIAQTELAISNGTAFLNTELSPADLLKIIDELSPYAQDYQTTLVRQQKQAGPVGELAVKIADKIQQARLALARESDRIRAAIDMLDGPLRHRMLAQQRLNKAGEYAAPQLVAVLNGKAPREQALRPYVIEAMVGVGRPLVAPLCESLLDLSAVPQQQVAEVLARIGYPLALPYLKAVIEKSDTDDATRAVLQKAYDGIIERTGVPADASAAQLFMALSEDYYYKRQSLILEPEADVNLMWTYDKQVGLTPLAVPTVVFHDAQSMRAAKRALRRANGMSAAYSMWIAANFRRENNLAAGQVDPSYPGSMQSPHFYAVLSGPSHLHPVLHRAINDADAELALDAIGALRSTAGTRPLVNTDGDLQPLLAALNYPDRRVRFEAAFTLAASMPRVTFSGQQRVVPVLAEAVREAGKNFAVTLAPNTDASAALSEKLSGAGQFALLPGASMDAVAEQIAATPGVDLIVVATSSADAQAAVAAARAHYKTMATPIIVLGAAGDIPGLNRTVGQEPGVWVTSTEVDAAAFKAAVDQALAWSAGAKLTDAQALAYATTALGILRDVTIEASDDAFNAVDAKPALFAALADARNDVVLGAARVLARFEGPDSQQALADAAFASKAAAQQIALLRSLAESARIHGNQLAELQLKRLNDMMANSTGDVADAAAEAHGSLDLPTSDGIQLIIK